MIQSQVNRCKLNLCTRVYIIIFCCYFCHNSLYLRFIRLYLWIMDLSPFLYFLTGMIITTTEGAARFRVAFYTVLSIGGGTIGIEQL